MPWKQSVLSFGKTSGVLFNAYIYQNTKLYIESFSGCLLLRNFSRRTLADMLRQKQCIYLYYMVKKRQIKVLLFKEAFKRSASHFVCCQGNHKPLLRGPGNRRPRSQWQVSMIQYTQCTLYMFVLTHFKWNQKTEITVNWVWLMTKCFMEIGYECRLGFFVFKIK